MSEPFEITRAASPGSTEVLRLKGRLDARSTLRLLESCSSIREAGKHVVLNLSEVTFLSSNGIGTLLALTEEFQDQSLTLRIAAASTAVRHAIELLNLHRFLNLHATEEEAVREAA